MFKIRLFLHILAGIAILSVCVSAVAWFLWPSSPLMALSTNRLDLGNGKPGEQVQGKFKIHNAGSRPLEYQIQSSCGCTKLTPRSGTVVPGGSQNVSLVLTLPEYAGTEKSIRVLVKGNDPHQPVATCLVTAKCPAPFEVTPKCVNFGELVSKDIGSASEVLEIRSLGGEVLKNPKRLRLRHESEHIQIVKELTAGGILRLKISLSPHTPCIELYDKLELQLGDSPDLVVNVPMYARVVEPVSVIPSTVFLRINPSTNKYQPIDLLLVNRCPSKPLGPVNIVDSNGAIRLEGDSHLDATRRKVRLVVLGEPEQASEMWVSLKFEGLDSACIVKIVNPKNNID